jgi:hypothetical protein
VRRFSMSSQSSLRISSGIYQHEDPSIIESPLVLYMDYNGYWAPLSHLYYSSSSRILVARHPQSCIEELQGFMYCPQCLTRFQGDDVKEYGNRCPTCFGCPRCTSVLNIVTSEFTEDPQVFLRCDLCHWVSSSSGIVGADKAALEKMIASKEAHGEQAAAYSKLLQAYQQADLAFIGNRDSKSTIQRHDLSYFMNSNNSIGKRNSDSHSDLVGEQVWGVQNLDENLKKCSDQSRHYNPVGSVRRNQALLNRHLPRHCWVSSQCLRLFILHLTRLFSPL